MSKSVLPIFSSKSFIDSGLIFRSLIHFELSLGMVLRSALISFFFFFHVAVQFSQHHLLETIFLHCIFLPPL